MLQSSPIFYNKYKSQIYLLQPEICHGPRNSHGDPSQQRTPRVQQAHHGQMAVLRRQLQRRGPGVQRSQGVVRTRCKQQSHAVHMAMECCEEQRGPTCREIFTVKKRNHLCIIVYHHVSSFIIISYQHILIESYLSSSTSISRWCLHENLGF